MRCSNKGTSSATHLPAVALGIEYRAPATNGYSRLCPGTSTAVYETNLGKMTLSGSGKEGRDNLVQGAHRLSQNG
eukprot:6491045-Amphidinium_carterae.2